MRRIWLGHHQAQYTVSYIQTVSMPSSNGWNGSVQLYNFAFLLTNYYILSGISLLALTVVQGYHGYVLFVWLYGICLGGYNYALKMFTLERIKGRHFTKAWSFIQGAKAIPVLVGIPITGYINQTYPKAGYYFSFVTTIIGKY